MDKIVSNTNAVILVVKPDRSETYYPECGQISPQVQANIDEV